MRMVYEMSSSPGMDYMRVTRADFPIFLEENADFEIGKAQKLLDGESITFLATGSMVYESLMVARELINEGLSVDFFNIHTIKPLDISSIVASATKTKKVVVVEEHNKE